MTTSKIKFTARTVFSVLLCALFFISCSHKYGIPSNQIHYLTVDKTVLEITDKGKFGGARIVSNTYSEKNGMGIIEFSKKLTKIWNRAFSNDSSLTSVTMPPSVTMIGEGAFSGCPSLESITIPPSVTEIGMYAFSGCSSLASITIPPSVTKIGSAAFSGCSPLTSIKVESDNSVYDSREDCNAIIHTESNALISGCKNTIIPPSVTEIAGGAFRGCTSLTSISLPPSVTKIGFRAFAGCSSLTSIKVESDNSVYDSREDCNAIIHTESNALISGCKNTVIPPSVTEIGYGAFYHCSSLTSITIPPSVTKIEGYAFAGCSSLTTVRVSKNTKIVGNAFMGCPNVKIKRY